MRKEVLMHNLELVLWLLLGSLLVYGYFLIDSSNEIEDYMNMSAGSGAGLRLITLIGVLKYGILFVGSSLMIMTIVRLIRERNS
ncbi:MAG: hypothetical protein WBG42_09745 [Cryomorphaceae bacterium]